MPTSTLSSMKRLSLLLPLCSLCLLGADCKDPTTPPAGCTYGFLGDPNQPMQLELFALDTSYLPVELPQCGPIDVVAPPQGGFVMFIGVRATNLEACGAKLTSALRDPTDNSILGIENRSTVFQPMPSRSGWGQTDSGGDSVTNGFPYVANLPVCPNVNARDITQSLGVLEIDVTDKAGKKGKLLQHVFPRCAQQSAAARSFCNCNCQANYSQSKCTLDGGVPVMNFPEPPDAGVCFPPDGGSPSDLAITDGASPDGK